MQLYTLQSELADSLLSSDHRFDLIVQPEHLPIYARNRTTRLIHALQCAYPLTQRLMGQDAFQLLAKSYIEQYPPCSNNLHDYGEYFDRFLEQKETAAPLPYLAEMAHFEWLCHQLYFAAESEELNPAALKNISPDQYDKLRFMLHPASRVCSFQYPLLDILALCKGGAEIAGKLDITQHQNKGLYLLIIRRHIEMQLVLLDAADYMFLDSLQANLALSAALDQALALDAHFKVEEKLLTWIQNKIIVDWTL